MRRRLVTAMIKILFLINTLGGGGAERVLVNLVNNMDPDRFDITVETMFDGGVNAALLHDNIHYFDKHAPCPRGIAYFFRMFSARQLYRFFVGDVKYDLLVAYMHGAPVKVIAGCPDPKVKKIAWLHNGNPDTGTFFKFWWRKKSAVAAYAACDRIVGVSNTVADAFSAYTGIPGIETVYNTNDVKRIRALASQKLPELQEKQGCRIVSVGRISAEKGYDRFFSVCSRLRAEGFRLEVTIVGDGEDAQAVRNRVRKANAEDWFHMVGFQDNPYPFVAQSDLYVCPSYQEGLSTAVLEALILGVPVVSTDVSGAKEILGAQDEFGIVTENSEEGLYAGLRRMLSDPALRAHYHAQAAKRAPFFETKATVRQAETLFDSVLHL